MSSLLNQCLDDLEERLDDAQEERLRSAWREFLDNRCGEDVFCPPPRRPNPSHVKWPEVHINDAQDDYELMLLDQFRTVSDALDGGASLLNVRCNYGTGILPSLFGAELFIMPRETKTLPGVIPLGGTERIRDIVEAGVPDPRSGLGRKVFECAACYQQVFHAYPKIARNVALYHPDVQGPVDVAELLWGSELFLAFYDEPDLLRSLLQLITETYKAFMREWFKLVPPSEYSAHWGMMHRGTLMLRDDSLMNLSAEMYVEFARPWDEQLLEIFGGGAIHFCGRGHHFIATMSETRGLTAVHLSQPNLNDMERIFRHTVDKGIKLIGLDKSAVLAAKASGRKLRGQVQTFP